MFSNYCPNCGEMTRLDTENHAVPCERCNTEYKGYIAWDHIWDYKVPTYHRFIPAENFIHRCLNCNNIDLDWFGTDRFSCDNCGIETVIKTGENVEGIAYVLLPDNEKESMEFRCRPAETQESDVIEEPEKKEWEEEC